MNKGIQRPKYALLFGIISTSVLFYVGCMSPSEHRQKADQTAQDIVAEKHQQALGRDGTVDIERPSTILRRRLIEEQDLLISGPASLGSDQLEPIAHWPDPDYPPKDQASEDAFAQVPPGQPLRLTLVEALQIGARNSSPYQNQKEEVFRAALSLDVRRNDFRTIFRSTVDSNLTVDMSGDNTVTRTAQSADIGVGQRLYNGADVSGGFAVDLANLLTGAGGSALGLAGDATVSIPLLAGSGRHIATHSLTQAERNVIYQLWLFEQYKKEFAVEVANNYLGVLQSLDGVRIRRENYRSVVASARRSRRLADAGRIQEIEVDQAAQSELRARQSWITSVQNYESSLDRFKVVLGLPPDAQIELDPADLTTIVEPTEQIRQNFLAEEELRITQPALSADDPIELEEPSEEDAGPWELDEALAARVALENRLDFRRTMEQVHDAQRNVVYDAEWLGTELTFRGSALFNSRRGSGVADDTQLRLDRGLYDARLLLLDLPLERTSERVIYRNSLINLERAVRLVQTQEDSIKLSLRNTLRQMRQTRENLYIQTKAVLIAEKRVRSVTLFLEAGRAQMRDLLDAQDALLDAQIALTGAAVSYRIAELQLQRDLGILHVDERGLWQEALPEELIYAQK